MMCIDLRKTFDRDYRIVTDPAAGVRNFDPWYWIIPCKFGEIYPAGGEDLYVMVTGKKLGKLMRTWPELTIKQDADDAVVFRFHLDQFKKVATRVGARRKRRLSPEQQKTLAKQGTANLEKFHRQRLVNEKRGKVKRSQSGGTNCSDGSVYNQIGDAN